MLQVQFSDVDVLRGKESSFMDQWRLHELNLLCLLSVQNSCLIPHVFVLHRKRPREESAVFYVFSMCD